MRPVCEVFDAAGVAAARLVVVIPACNEAERIGACLAALASQEERGGCAVHVCVNNTDDDTAEIVRDRARRHGLALVLSEVRLPRGGVGRARRLGHLLAMRFSPKAGAFLSTDADCEAEPGWLGAMRAALEAHPAVLGRIEGLDDLPPDLLEKLRHGGRVEDDYMRLSMEFARLVSDDEATSIGLNTAGGANLGICREVYRAIGGFRPLTSREDRDLIDRVMAAGYRPARAEEAVVRASMRSEGRAPGGMADKIAERLSGGAMSLDTALAPVSAMLARVSCGGPHPGDVSLTRAAADLPILAAHVDQLRHRSCPEERRRYLRSARIRD
jgi:GT2 family glycosyltransferase